MNDLLTKILVLFTKTDRRRSVYLLLMILFMAMLDAFGAASILPFMSVVTNPEIIHDNSYLLYLFEYGGFSNSDDFIKYLGGFSLLLLISSSIFKALTTYVLLRFAHMGNYTISIRMIEGYLGKPYEWFLSRHTSELAKNILNEVQQTVNGVVIPMLMFVAQIAVSISLLVLLLVVDFWLTLIVGIILIGSYSIIYYFLQGYLSKSGEDRLSANKQRFKIVQEGFSSIKEVKLGNHAQTFIKRFSIAAKIYAKSIASAQISGQLPRFALESLAFGGVLLIVIYQIDKPGGFIAGIPTLSVFALASYKLMPSLQQVFVNATQIRFSQTHLHKLYDDLIQMGSTDIEREVDSTIIGEATGLKKYLFLNNIS